MDFRIKHKETHHNFMSNIRPNTREQEEKIMMNVENRIAQISQWLQVKSMPEVRNLTGEISELLYFSTHPEEEGE
jgi:DNA/RNA endonuclease G (NUC1)